jgi:hypothetical protein
MPDGFRPFSIERIIIKSKTAQMELKNSINTPLVNPIIKPKRSVRFKNED